MKHPNGGYTVRRYKELYKGKPKYYVKSNIAGKKQKIFPIEELNNRKGLIARKCPNCFKEFAVYECTVKNCHTTFCSPECYKSGRTIEKRYAHRMGKSVGDAKKVLNAKGFYKDKKSEYKDKIIPFKDSPTGKAYIGINKAPLMPVEGGNGFQGVLIQDENRELIQCHSCGKWMRKIASFHLKSCCGLSAKEYKTKYGLNQDGGLVSDETSLRLTENCLKNKEGMERFAEKSREGKMNGRHGRNIKHSIEFMNSKGTCPLQLKTRLYEFIRCNRELPAQGNKGRSIYKALRTRFGTFSHALTAHGLPFMKRTGTTMRFAFTDGTVYKYNMNQFYDREELYNLMIQKCPVLQS